MKKQIGEWYQIAEGIKILVKQEMPVGASFKLARIALTLQKELQLADEKKNELIRRYGEADDSRSVITVTEENRQVFVEQVSELMAEDLDLQIEPIKISALGDLQVAPAVFAACADLFSEE